MNHTSAEQSSEFNTRPRSLPEETIKMENTEGQPRERGPFLIPCLLLLLQEFPVPPKRNSQWLYQDL